VCTCHAVCVWVWVCVCSGGALCREAAGAGAPQACFGVVVTVAAFAYAPWLPLSPPNVAHT
jgi:hypothetical protein